MSFGQPGISEEFITSIKPNKKPAVACGKLRCFCWSRAWVIVFDPEDGSRMFL
jgi:hypothetical protein